jgi:hypothetical protein
VNKSDPTTWLDVFTAISPLLAALLAISGVLATIFFTSRRERGLARDRQEHERLLKEAELEAAQAARLRDERIAAYRKLLVATTTSPVDITREEVFTILEACQEISLLYDSDKLNEAASKVWTTYRKASKIVEKMGESSDLSAADRK